MTNHLGKKENLISLDKKSAEERKKIASLGGKASGEARKRKKLMKQQLDILLANKIKDPTVLAKLEKMGVKKSDTNYQTAVLVSMILEATKGNVKAAEFIRETLGEGNKNTIEQPAFTTNGTMEAFFDKLSNYENSFDKLDEVEEDGTREENMLNNN